MFIIPSSYNESLAEGSLPTQWKQANVKALFRKGKRTLCSNDKPVSVTSIICEMLESVIRKHILLFLETHNILSNSQHGFRNGYSCPTQLLSMMNNFTNLIVFIWIFRKLSIVFLMLDC